MRPTRTTRRGFHDGVEHRLQGIGERLMTLSTSEEAVGFAGFRQLARARLLGLESRAFSMAMTA